MEHMFQWSQASNHKVASSSGAWITHCCAPRQGTLFNLSQSNLLKYGVNLYSGGVNDSHLLSTKDSGYQQPPKALMHLHG